MRKILLLLMLPVMANAHQITQVVWFKNFPPGAKYNNNKIENLPTCNGCSNFSSVSARYPTLTPPRDPLGTKNDQYDLECSGDPNIFGAEIPGECKKQFSTDITWMLSGSNQKTCTVTIVLDIYNSLYDTDHSASYTINGDCNLTTNNNHWIVSPK